MRGDEEGCIYTLNKFAIWNRIQQKGEPSTYYAINKKGTKAYQININNRVKRRTVIAENNKIQCLSFIQQKKRSKG